MKNIYYSCVIDNHPKFYWQGYIFVISLTKIAKVNPSRIFVHMTSKNEYFESFLRDNKINVKYIKPWGDNKYCNKIQQLETTELKNADYVFFCDADIAIIEDLTNLAEDNLNNIIGKTVDFPNPDINTLKTILDKFNLKYPHINKYTINKEETFDGNFNGGLYGIPGKKLHQVSTKWKYYAKEMLDSLEIKKLLGNKVCHIDQISFFLSLQDLKFKYHILGYEYNCPTHINNSIELVKKSNKIKVLHYHSNLTDTGLLNNLNNHIIDRAVNIINESIKNNFNNVLFWNYRYATKPELCSGIGSRGEIALYKINLLKKIGITNSDVLDIGCGDLEIIKNLPIKEYTGVDISSEAIENAKISFPELKFFNYITEKDKIIESDTVLCLDVLIHQTNQKDYNELLTFITEKALNRVIISGYEKRTDKSHMCFFYENIKESLEKTKKYKYIFKIGEYKGLGIFIADKGELSAKNSPNDISNQTINNILKKNTPYYDLLLESITISRNTFQWFTKHYPRLYEYPWLLQSIGKNLKGLKVVDFGSGVTPLPLQLTQRGANVYTIDNNKSIRELNNISNANEWGFFNYNNIDKNIMSYNKSLDINTFKENSIDIWYSISVIEHLPSYIRRELLLIISKTLKNKGKIFLTIDLIKDTKYLWNMSEGKKVEENSIHGTMDELIQELEILGFKIKEKLQIKMPDFERVDIGMISAFLEK